MTRRETSARPNHVAMSQADSGRIEYENCTGASQPSSKKEDENTAEEICWMTAKQKSA
jgi:hypothetical protein